MSKINLINSANSLTMWSFLGAIVPIAGIVLLLIAYLRLEDVQHRKLSDSDIESIHRIKGMMRISASVSVIMILLGLMLVVNDYQQHTKQQEKARQQIESIINYY